MSLRRDVRIWAVTCTFAAVFGVAIGLGFVGITRDGAGASAGTALPAPVEFRAGGAPTATSVPSAVSRRTALGRAAGPDAAVTKSAGVKAAKHQPVTAKHPHPAAKGAAANGSRGKTDDKVGMPVKTKKAKK